MQEIRLNLNFLLFDEFGQLAIVYWHHLNLSFVLSYKIESKLDGFLIHKSKGTAFDRYNLIRLEESLHISHCPFYFFTFTCTVTPVNSDFDHLLGYFLFRVEFLDEWAHLSIEKGVCFD